MTSAKVLIADATDTGKKGPAGHESIWGGAGNDNLIGLSRCDILTDGWGDNTSVFLATIDSRVGNGQRDLIPTSGSDMTVSISPQSTPIRASLATKHLRLNRALPAMRSGSPAGY